MKIAKLIVVSCLPFFFAVGCETPGQNTAGLDSAAIKAAQDTAKAAQLTANQALQAAQKAASEALRAASAAESAAAEAKAAGDKADRVFRKGIRK